MSIIDTLISFRFKTAFYNFLEIISIHTNKLENEYHMTIP